MESRILLKPELGVQELLHFPLVLINRLNKTESAGFLYCRFSLFLKGQFFQIILGGNAREMPCEELVQGICWGRLGRNSHHMGPEFRHKWDPGRSGSLPKSIHIFFRATYSHSVTTQTQAVVTIYYNCILILLPFNGNSMCNG